MESFQEKELRKRRIPNNSKIREFLFTLWLTCCLPKINIMKRDGRQLRSTVWDRSLPERRNYEGKRLWKAFLLWFCLFWLVFLVEPVAACVSKRLWQAASKWLKHEQTRDRKKLVQKYKELGNGHRNQRKTPLLTPVKRRRKELGDEEKKKAEQQSADLRP